MWSDCSLFICYQIYGISYQHLIIKQKNASPENWSKCTYDLIAFSRRIAFPIPKKMVNNCLNILPSIKILCPLIKVNLPISAPNRPPSEGRVEFMWNSPIQIRLRYLNQPTLTIAARISSPGSYGFLRDDLRHHLAKQSHPLNKFDHVDCSQILSTCFSIFRICGVDGTCLGCVLITGEHIAIFVITNKHLLCNKPVAIIHINRDKYPRSSSHLRSNFATE